jgi:imidazolonepropionase-like amidohydrolase
VVEGNRISQVGDAKKVHAPKGAQVVNARGLYAIPGLWDMHVQIRETDRAFPLLIANGVLGVRNFGGSVALLKRLRAQVINGELLGPRMVISGPMIEGVNPPHSVDSIVVQNPAQARAAVDTLKQGGVDFIAISSDLTADEYNAIAEEAKKLGVPFAGDLPQGVWATDASTAGQLSIEGLDGSLAESSKNFDQIVHLNDSPAAGSAERNARALAILKLETGGFDPERLKNLIALFVNDATRQVPMLVSSRIMAFLNESATVKDARLGSISQQILKEWNDTRDRSIADHPPEYWALLRSAYQLEVSVLHEYHRGGVSILGGTDAGEAPFVIPGVALHEELAAFVEAGFTPLEALQSVTRDAAETLGLGDEFGAVANGKVADFVLLDANPLDDIHNTKKIHAVILEGKYLDRAALDAK